jgi:LuxR family maltose regulon positive regulatory protein
MPKADPLIRTKLRLPFTRSELVPRPRLQEQVASGLRGPLTLVIAPAGFGKTTLVASCVAGSGTPAAWLSLDKEDNQSGRFLAYLAAALQGANPAVGSEAAQLLEGMQQAPPEAVLTSLVNDLDAAPGEMALVLDDYQFISSPAVHAAVAFLLEHCPPTFHLLIATRSDPALPLARLRARGQTVELRAGDLSFTEAEAARFLNDVMGLHLDAQAVALLAARTEGWAAGLQMAALSMRDRDDVGGFIKGFSGTNRHILDYLLEEVLAREPEEVQNFLLQTSILTRLTGPLCEAVTGASGGQEMLERLERRNLFVVPLDDERRWYRYHHLFADLLQARLHQSGPGLARQLFGRAAAWCDQDGERAEAVRYALASQDYAQAALLVEKYWAPVANNGEIETVWSWLDALPVEVVKRRASLSVAYCWVLWLRGQVGLIEAHLEDAERAVSEMAGPEEAGTDDPMQVMLPATVAVLRSIVARQHEDFEAAIAVGERALGLLPEYLPPEVAGILRTLIYLALASAYDGAGDLDKAADAYVESIRGSFLAANPGGLTGMTYRMNGILQPLGRLREADAACRQALAYLQVQGMARLPAAGVLHVAMSELLVERNDLEAAQAHLALGFELAKWSGRYDAVRNAPTALSRLRLARQDAAGALAAIQDAETAFKDAPSPLVQAGLQALRARILVQQGSLGEAARCAEEAVRLAGRDRGQIGQVAALAALRVRLAQCGPGEAVELLTRSLAEAEEGGRRGVVLELQLLRSLALARQGDARRAEADLERALALAEAEGYVRRFLDEGQPMQQLLAGWLKHAGPGPLRDYAARLLAQFEAEPHPAAPEGAKLPLSEELVEPLTPRELEVLELICAGDSNQAIAEQLVITLSAVKKHTSNILGKLGVTSRAQAMVRARQLGLIPTTGF